MERVDACQEKEIIMVKSLFSSTTAHTDAFSATAGCNPKNQEMRCAQYFEEKRQSSRIGGSPLKFLLTKYHGNSSQISDH
jgi:hypothetical protein